MQRKVKSEANTETKPAGQGFQNSQQYHPLHLIFQELLPQKLLPVHKNGEMWKARKFEIAKKQRNLKSLISINIVEKNIIQRNLKLLSFMVSV